MSAPIIFVELPTAVALATTPVELDIPRGAYTLPAVAGKLLAERVPFGHATRCYNDFISDEGQQPSREDYEQVGNYLARVRRGLAQEITGARAALNAQPALIFQSFHNFLAQLKQNEAVVVLRYQPHQVADPLIQELEFFHDVKFSRAQWKEGKLYYGESEEPTEMKECLEEGFHVWQDEEGLAPMPKSMPSVTFSVTDLYHKGTWRDPIDRAMVVTHEPIPHLHIAQARGELIVVDPWRALHECDYYRLVYQQALTMRADADTRTQKWQLAQTRLERKLVQDVQDTLDRMRDISVKRDRNSAPLNTSPLEQSQFYLLLQKTIQAMTPSEKALLNCASDPEERFPFQWVNSDANDEAAANIMVHVREAAAAASAPAAKVKRVKRARRVRARRGQAAGSSAAAAIAVEDEPVAVPAPAAIIDDDGPVAMEMA